MAGRKKAAEAPPAPTPSPIDRWLLLPFLILALAVAIERFAPFHDPDLFWHLRVGADILTHGIPDTDRYSYTLPGHRWVDHEWALDVALAKLHAVGGFPALAGAAILIAGSAFLVGSRIGRAGQAGRALAWGLLLPLAVMAARTGLGISAQCVSWLGLALVMHALESHPDWHRDRRARWQFPLLFALWANLHAGFALGLALLGAASLLAAIRSRRLAATLPFGLSCAATLLNPYGIRLHEEVVTVLLDDYARRTIAEWKPPDYSSPLLRGLLAYQIVVAALVVVAALFRRHRPPSFRLGTTLVLGWMLRQSLRHATLFALVSLPLAAEALAALLTPLLARKPWTWPAFRIGALAAATLAAGGLAWPRVVATYHANTVRALAGYPKAALDFIRAQKLEGRVVAEYGWGGFISWYAPEMPIFIDGRMASWNAPGAGPRRPTGAHVLREFHALAESATSRQEIVEKYQIEYLLGERGAYDAAGASLRAPNVVYADAIAVLTRFSVAKPLNNPEAAAAPTP